MGEHAVLTITLCHLPPARNPPTTSGGGGGKGTNPGSVPEPRYYLAPGAIQVGPLDTAALMRLMRARVCTVHTWVWSATLQPEWALLGATNFYHSMFAHSNSPLPPAQHPTAFRELPVELSYAVDGQYAQYPAFATPSHPPRHTPTQQPQPTPQPTPRWPATTPTPVVSATPPTSRAHTPPDVSASLDAVAALERRLRSAESGLRALEAQVGSLRDALARHEHTWHGGDHKPTSRLKGRLRESGLPPGQRSELSEVTSREASWAREAPRPHLRGGTDKRPKEPWVSSTKSS